MNNIKVPQSVLKKIEAIVSLMENSILTETIHNYGNVATKKFFSEVLDDKTLVNAA